MAKIRLGSHSDQEVQFTVGLQDRDVVARYRVGREPAVRRKEANRNGTQHGRDD
jgi:hypothetical protein